MTHPDRLPDPGDQFARYVTSTAFSLSLSGQMVSALDHLTACPIINDRWVVGPPSGWVQSCSALLRRGLAYRIPRTDHPQWEGPIRVSDAGRLVHQLCVMAGLALPVDSPDRKWPDERAA